MTESDSRHVVLERRHPPIHVLPGARRTRDGADADPHLHTVIDAGSNSIAVTVKHVGGNRQRFPRFGEFLTTDGEKQRIGTRDTEFETAGPASREEILGWWRNTRDG